MKRDDTRAKLAADVEAFLAQGGEIERVTGFENVAPLPKHTPPKKSARAGHRRPGRRRRGLQKIRQDKFVALISALMQGEVDRNYLCASMLGQAIGVSPITARRYLETLEAQGYTAHVVVQKKRQIYVTTPLLKRELARLAREMGVHPAA